MKTMTSCAALLAAYFGGMQLADIDKTNVYDVPATLLAQMTFVQRATARACALRYGVRYRVQKAG
jgi:hypothetical protein